MLLVGVVCEPVLKVKLPAHQQQFLMQNRAAGAEQQSLRERRSAAENERESRAVGAEYEEEESAPD